MYPRRCTHGFFILFSNLEQTDTDPAADFGAKCSLEETNILKITHETIAGHMGTAREVVTRMLRYFQNESMVKLTRGTVEVTDKAALEELQNA